MAETERAAPTEGWVTLVNSRKFHYVRDGRSLCKGWAYLGATFDSDDGKLGGAPQRGDCAACWRARKKELP